MYMHSERVLSNSTYSFVGCGREGIAPLATGCLEEQFQIESVPVGSKVTMVLSMGVDPSIEHSNHLHDHHHLSPPKRVLPKVILLLACNKELYIFCHDLCNPLVFNP